MRISDWSSDVCSSDLLGPRTPADSVLLREDSVRDVRANAAAAVRANAAESSATTRVLLIMPISLSSSNASLSAYTLPTTRGPNPINGGEVGYRSEEKTSELQSIMRR